MAEIEIHAHHAHTADQVGKTVSIMVALTGIVLAIVTIGSHRAHTSAVIHRTEANDQWAFYQAKKTREHLVEGIAGLVGTVTVNDAQKARALADKLSKDGQRYSQEAKDIQKEAQEREAASDREERRALRLDIAEGFLDLGLVLSSLYFLSKRRFFPVLGGTAAVVGAVIGATNFLL